MTDADLTPATGVLVAPGSVRASECSIDVLDVEGDQVSVGYAGLPGNQPHSWGDFIGIWSGTVIPFGSKPLAASPVPSDLESGSVVVSTTITSSSYTAAYSLGAEVTALCAAQLIGAGGQLGARQAVQMAINNIGESSISIAYTTLPGYMPSKAGNWVGLWKGEIDPYQPGDPVGTTKVTSDSNMGDLAILAPLGIKETYTLVYFMGEALTTASVTLTFDTSKPT